MADIRSSTWSTTAGDNNASPPDGWPEGQSPSSVNNCAREMMAAIKRAWNDDHPVNASAGSNSAYTLVTSASSTAYATGDMYAFRANHASVGTSTLNVNGIGARVIKKFGNQDTIADDIKVNQVVQVAYEPSADIWQLLTAAEAPNLSNLADVDLSGGAATGDALVYDGTNWSAGEALPSTAATGDTLVYDGTSWAATSGVNTVNVISLSTGSITAGDAIFEIKDLPSNVVSIEFIGSKITPSANCLFGLQVSNNNGLSYDTTTSYDFINITGTGGVANNNSGTTSNFRFSGTADAGRVVYFRGEVSLEFGSDLFASFLTKYVTTGAAPVISYFMNTKISFSGANAIRLVCNATGTFTGSIRYIIHTA